MATPITGFERAGEELPQLLRSLNIGVGDPSVREEAPVDGKPPKPRAPILPLTDQLSLLSAHIDNVRDQIATTVSSEEGQALIQDHTRRAHDVQARLTSLEGRLGSLEDGKEDDLMALEQQVLDTLVSYTQAQQAVSREREVGQAARLLHDSVAAVEALETALSASSLDVDEVSSALVLVESTCLLLGLGAASSHSEQNAFAWIGASGSMLPHAVGQLSSRIAQAKERHVQVLDTAWKQAIEITPVADGKASLTITNSMQVTVMGQTTTISLYDLTRALHKRNDLLPRVGALAKTLVGEFVGPMLSITSTQGWKRDEQDAQTWTCIARGQVDDSLDRRRETIESALSLFTHLDQRLLSDTVIVAAGDVRHTLSKYVVPKIVPILTSSLRDLLPSELELTSDTFQSAVRNLDVVKAIAKRCHATLKDSGLLDNGLDEEAEDLLSFSDQIGRSYIRHLGNLARSRCRDILLKEQTGGWESVSVEMDIQVTATQAAKQLARANAAEDNEVEQILQAEKSAQPTPSREDSSKELGDGDTWDAWNDEEEEQAPKSSLRAAKVASLRSNSRSSSQPGSRSHTPTSLEAPKARHKKSALGGVRVVKPQDELGSGPFPTGTQDDFDDDGWGFDDEVVSTEDGLSALTTSSMASSTSATVPAPPALDDEEDAWFQDEVPALPPTEQAAVRPETPAQTSSSASHANASVTAAAQPSSSYSMTPNALDDLDDEDIDEDAWGLTEEEKVELAAKRASMRASRTDLASVFKAMAPMQETAEESAFQNQPEAEPLSADKKGDAAVSTFREESSADDAKAFVDDEVPSTSADSAARSAQPSTDVRTKYAPVVLDDDIEEDPWDMSPTIESRAADFSATEPQVPASELKDADSPAAEERLSEDAQKLKPDTEADALQAKEPDIAGATSPSPNTPVQPSASATTHADEHAVEQAQSTKIDDELEAVASYDPTTEASIHADEPRVDTSALLDALETTRADEAQEGDDAWDLSPTEDAALSSTAASEAVPAPAQVLETTEIDDAQGADNAWDLSPLDAAQMPSASAPPAASAQNEALADSSVLFRDIGAQPQMEMPDDGRDAWDLSPQQELLGALPDIEAAPLASAPFVEAGDERPRGSLLEDVTHGLRQPQAETQQESHTPSDATAADGSMSTAAAKRLQYTEAMRSHDEAFAAGEASQEELDFASALFAGSQDAADPWDIEVDTPVAPSMEAIPNVASGDIPFFASGGAHSTDLAAASEPASPIADVSYGEDSSELRTSRAGILHDEAAAASSAVADAEPTQDPHTKVHAGEDEAWDLREDAGERNEVLSGSEGAATGESGGKSISSGEKLSDVPTEAWDDLASSERNSQQISRSSSRGPPNNAAVAATSVAAAAATALVASAVLASSSSASTTPAANAEKEATAVRKERAPALASHSVDSADRSEMVDDSLSKSASDTNEPAEGQSTFDAWGWEDDERELAPPSAAASAAPVRSTTKPATHGPVQITEPPPRVALPPSPQQKGITTAPKAIVPAKPKKETCMISQRSVAFLKLVSTLLDDIVLLSTTDMHGTIATGDVKGLVDALKDVLDLHQALMPVSHAETLQNVPTLAAQFANDCVYIARELEHLDERFLAASKESSSITASSDVSFKEHAALAALLGQRTFDTKIFIQQQALAECLAETSGFEATYEDQRFRACQRSMQQVITIIKQLGRAWSPPVLGKSRYLAAMGRIIDSVLRRVIRDITSLEDISEVEGNRLAELLKSLTEVEELFRAESSSVADADAEQSSDVAVHVPSWFKASYLVDILTGSLVDIEFLYFEAQALVDYSKPELVRLIRALFSDTPKRARLIDRIQQQ